MPQNFYRWWFGVLWCHWFGHGYIGEAWGGHMLGQPISGSISANCPRCGTWITRDFAADYKPRHLRKRNEAR